MSFLCWIFRCRWQHPDSSCEDYCGRCGKTKVYMCEYEDEDD